MPAPGSSGDVQALSTNTAADEFAAFYRSNYQSALQFVRYRASGADCEALVADAFILAWQHAQRSGDLSRAWFYGVLRNKIGDFYRSARRREIPSEILEASLLAENQTAHSDDHLDVLRVLRSLPETHSEPLILVYWCDLSTADAAKALGVREGNLRVKLHRARRAFLKAFDQQTGRATTIEEVTLWTVQND